MSSILDLKAEIWGGRWFLKEVLKPCPIKRITIPERLYEG
jgi:hypothetical protein